MRLRTRRLAPFLLVLATLLGCQNTPSNTTQSTVGVVKVAVMADGTVYVNSELVPIDDLSAKLDAIEDIQEFWYHRENPGAAEPHENAMKVIAAIADRQLPIAMYLDREFTQRADLGGR